MICKKEKDSKNTNKNNKIKFKKISRLRVTTITRFEDKIAYLFFESHPIKNKSKEKNKDKIPIKSKLYSISQSAKLGPQIRLIQNK